MTPLPGHSDSRPPLTLLYVPADRPDRVRGALAGDADVVLVDLEDAVLPAAKAAARAALPELLDGIGRPVQVRVNGVDTPWHAADLITIRGLPPAVEVRIPKCEEGPAVVGLGETLPGRRLHLLIESALGVERAFALATCHPSVVGISLGESDLRADLGIDDEAGLTYARSRLVTAAAAAGLAPPPMSVFADVRDLDGLAESTRRGRELGFLGRTAIHPRQLPVIRAVFRPTDRAVRAARDLLAAAAEGAGAGHGAVALADGRFVDEAVLRQARRTLRLAEATTELPQR